MITVDGAKSFRKGSFLFFLRFDKNDKGWGECHGDTRALSISHGTNVIFPNSPNLDKFTVMGVVIVSWSCFYDLLDINNYLKHPYIALCLF